MILCKIMPSFSRILAFMREKLTKREKNGSKKRKAPQHCNSCAMSASSTKYLLPGELIDQVIDHLHDDSPSLRACCITCRAWVPSARFHIFHNIVLSEKHADALAVILETSPHIFPLFRSLTLKGNPEHMYEGLDYLDAVIPTIAPKLTKLKTLRVQRVSLAQQHPKVLSALVHNFATIQDLCIESVSFKTFRDLAALIAAHPFLECLDLTFIRWERSDSVIAKSRCEDVFQEYLDLPSRLRCIKLSDLPIGAIIDWMSSYYRVLPVHTMVVTEVSTIFIQDHQMARLFQVIGSSLEHLTFCIYQYHLKSPEKTLMDLLPSNTRLRTLTFDNTFLELPWDGPTYVLLPVLLSQLTSRYIEEISFVLFWSEVNTIEAVDLKRVQDIITKPGFSGLKRVIFRWRGSVDLVEGSQAIRAQMDQLDGMGLLVFQCQKSQFHRLQTIL
ncbi:hypothetical protein JB92DRAFT_3140624 [Gautieria morchelliformis]|nr:hypothetical protein JB92DRAFT_3140624 [Gautieria morchelliformis]